MFILDKDATNNAPPQVPMGNFKKSWFDIGNGKEILVKNSATIKEEDKAATEIITTKKKVGRIDSGDLVFVKGKWCKLEEVKDNKGSIKDGDQIIAVTLSECKREIPIRILFCNMASQSIYLMELNGRKVLSKISSKFSQRQSVKTKKADWYYNGKLLEPGSTIESIQVKPNDKLVCMMLGYDMKTFKRFKRLDDSRGWYMSHSSGDSITFIPSKRIQLFGFGMYYTREGPPTYTLNYELFINEESKLKASVICTKPGQDAIVMPIYFDPNCAPSQIEQGTKIIILVKYEQYDEGSKLIVGTDGNSYDTVEGNEVGLFKLEENGRSGNGTDINAGQIPELYYALTD